MIYYIYSLAEPNDGIVKYIGYTLDIIKKVANKNILYKNFYWKIIY